jgi:hypothetical protein
MFRTLAQIEDAQRINEVQRMQLFRENREGGLEPALAAMTAAWNALETQRKYAAEYLAELRTGWYETSEEGSHEAEWNEVTAIWDGLVTVRVFVPRDGPEDPLYHYYPVALRDFDLCWHWDARMNEKDPVSATLTVLGECPF